MRASTTLAFIGGGNMARSMLGGLLHCGWRADDLCACDPQPAQRQQLAQQFGIRCFDDNQAGVARSQIIVFAVKPQRMQQAVASIAAHAQQHQPLLISIAAGVRCAEVLRWAGGSLDMVRAMPNTPALVNAGISALFAPATVPEKQRKLAQRVMQSVGETLWLPAESLLDVVTAISGSGPAYFFNLMEQLVAGATQHGLDPAHAQLLAVQTAAGAARLAQHSSHTAAELRAQVTSPGGTTEAALSKMAALGLDNAIQQGIAAAITRSRQLADQLAAAPDLAPANPTANRRPDSDC